MASERRGTGAVVVGPLAGKAASATDIRIQLPSAGPSIVVGEVGAHVSGKTVRFGVYLPGVHAADGYEVRVQVIHAADQFVPEIDPITMALTEVPDHPLGLWNLSFDLAPTEPDRGHFGSDGTYLFRYQLWNTQRDAKHPITKVFLDPFATENGPGLLAAFRVPPAPRFAWTDADYRTPPLDELIVYELNVAQFAGTFDGVRNRLDYLQGLGINCIELMPIMPVKTEFDWGYGPIGYYAPEDYLGGPDGLKKLVDAAHARGIAVILDVVYGHADGAEFAYARVYDDTGLPNPMMQTPNRDRWGRGFDHTLALARQYCLEANKYWLDEYHVDGFRYDNVPGFYDGNPMEKYGTLVFQTYLYSQGIPRFDHVSGFSRIIQVAEDLGASRDVLRRTFSSAAWQDDLLARARDLAANCGARNAESFAHTLDPAFGASPYPDSQDGGPAGDAAFPVAPFQYLNSHDHSWLITSFGLEDPLVPDDIRFGKRCYFYKLQPYAIGLLAAKGIPMLWEGEELAENYQVANGGNIRISFLRGMHWEYFYDANGNPLVRVYRRMGKLRRALPALRSRDYFYYNEESRPGEGVIVFRRTAKDQVALVALNFSDRATDVTIPAPLAGTYREMLDPAYQSAATRKELIAAKVGDPLKIQLNSWYGRVFVTPPAEV